MIRNKRWIPLAGMAGASPQMSAPVTDQPSSMPRSSTASSGHSDASAGTLDGEAEEDRPLGAVFDDMEYFQERAEQELAWAQRSEHVAVVAAHYEMAERYLERVFQLPNAHDRRVSEAAAL